MPKEIDAITKLYDFILWIVPKLERFPRGQKFLLGRYKSGHHSSLLCKTAHYHAKCPFDVI